MSPSDPIEEEFDDSDDEFNEDPFFSNSFPGQVPIEKLLKMYPPPDNTTPPSESPAPQIEIIQPILIDETLSSPAQAEPEPTESPVEVKRGRGAPKGNLNALKHGLYMNNSYISNTTPVERARLCDLNSIIEHVKSYIGLAYENGKTLKDTSEINETLKAISLASIALARLLHTHNQYMFTSLPSNLKGDSNQAVNKMLDFYQKKVGAFFELTNLQSDQE